MKKKLMFILVCTLTTTLASATGGIICEPNGAGPGRHLCDAFVQGVNPSTASYSWSGSGGIGVSGSGNSAIATCSSGSSGTINVTVNANGTQTTLHKGLSCDSMGNICKGRAGRRCSRVY